MREVADSSRRSLELAWTRKSSFPRGLEKVEMAALSPSSLYSLGQNPDKMEVNLAMDRSSHYRHKRALKSSKGGDCCRALSTHGDSYCLGTTQHRVASLDIIDCSSNLPSCNTGQRSKKTNSS